MDRDRWWSPSVLSKRTKIWIQSSRWGQTLGFYSFRLFDEDRSEDSPSQPCFGRGWEHEQELGITPHRFCHPYETGRELGWGSLFRLINDGKMDTVRWRFPSFCLLPAGMEIDENIVSKNSIVRCTNEIWMWDRSPRSPVLHILLHRTLKKFLLWNKVFVKLY